ncbi:Aminomethyltransferase, mitochondrial [Coniosporium apollinis]|uniref:Aminomethyltransferase n=2 Tax=Coniosporium TaxID=2810619 RepID=A0ABQ9P3H1_9PEZI|nr:Aminomethyltransferase, mitochondrial [Cladosporium sp. JES 115]KAJ9668613.1 Aminomethyltransferase, mitochondrial [Coniosporium apollinis]
MSLNRASGRLASSANCLRISRTCPQLLRPARRSLLSQHVSQQRRPAVRPAAPLRPGIAGQPARYASSKPTEGSEPAKTPLYDLHAQHGAKFVPFGGYSMPVQYSDLSVGDSHNWTREKASLFDVSHMVQHHLTGPGSTGFLSQITPSSVSTLETHHSTLSALLHPGTGGIVDDTIITRLGPEAFYIVTNAGCREKDTRYLADQLSEWHQSGGEKVDWQVLKGQGLVALQGPLAPSILQDVLFEPQAVDLQKMYFGQSKYLKLRLPSGEPSVEVLASRGGYTGEDGFEISIPGPQTTEITELLLKSAGEDKLRLAGLGARDSLRLEAGMCLYGHDLDDSTTPVEAGLSWIIGKDRRTEGGFHGSEVILQQLKPKKEGGGVSRRRIGLIVEGAPAREGAEIVNKGEKVGKVTSGCPSPTLKKNIAMGYIKQGLNKAGTEVEVVVRGKNRKAVVSKMPFVPSKYWKGGASPA